MGLTGNFEETRREWRRLVGVDGQEGRVDDDDVVAFAQRLGFEPDEKQKVVLRSEAKRGILNCARQWGKSTVSAVKAVHRAWTREGSLVLVASPTGRQSAEWMRKAAEFVEGLGVKPKGDGANAMSLALPNGSRIVGLPGTGTAARVRGFSAVSMLLIDEASFVADEMYRALRPMLAVGNGDLWLMSTPGKKRGFFYEEWEMGGSEWERVRGAATECERVPARFLEEERDKQGAESFAQEYLCCFLDDGREVFGRDLVEASLSDEVEPLDVTCWKRRN